MTTTLPDTPTLVEDLMVIDADSHLTERHDLFTSRAPKGFEDKVPHVEEIDGMDMWVLEGKTFGKAGSGGTIDHAGITGIGMKRPPEPSWISAR